MSGCAAKMRKYPWGSTEPLCGVHAVLSSGGDGCGKDQTWAVKTGSASGRGPFGHYDLAGNVYEWVSDWYASGYYGVSPLKDPENTNVASYRVERGGSFVGVAAGARAGFRYVDGPSVAYGSLGARCARSFP